MTVLLEALKPLYNKTEYGRVEAGQRFEASARTARLLEIAKSARRVYEETVLHAPAPAPEVSTREPFHFLPVSDQEPAAVAAASDRVLPETELPQPGAAHRSQRARRKASDPAE